MKERKKFLVNLLCKYFSRVQEHVEVKHMLTTQEAENGIETIIERIVEKLWKRQANSVGS